MARDGNLTGADMGERAGRWLDSGGWFDWTPTEPMRHTERLRIFHVERGDPEAPLRA
jgi:hypothetical protein